MADKSLEKLSEEELNNQLKLLEEELGRLKEEKKDLQRKISSNEDLQRDYRNSIRKCRSLKEGIKIDNYKKGLFQEYGNSYTKKQLEKVWIKAWEKGHSSGLDEVRNHFIDLLELFD